ncbi:HAMP domain-containing protein, partial [Rhodococcus hoagii]|nr:HAMP domain-containing protein [Prescottella equi]
MRGYYHGIGGDPAGTVDDRYLLTRSIIVPLAEAVTAAERVAASDLTQPITAQGRDEPALLL